ncbi:2-dehydro-3-deoxy-6-phosphogalactonate aldolase, partial [bacterium]
MGKPLPKAGVFAHGEAKVVARKGASFWTKIFAVNFAAGADALKLFPAEASSPAALRAMLTVLPPRSAVLPVGGIGPEVMGAWLAAGAAGFGIGSALFRPGISADDASQRATRLVSAVRAA